VHACFKLRVYQTPLEPLLEVWETDRIRLGIKGENRTQSWVEQVRNLPLLPTEHSLFHFCVGHALCSVEFFLQ
jgi:hypothetical protein